MLRLRICSGLFIMTGDVLPCFDASAMVLPDDTSCIITVPITLDVASNHGVIVASKTGDSDEVCAVSPVANLLQKPSVEELSKHHAILDDGRALLDTGIIAVRGKAWEDLVTLSCLSQPMISELLNTGKEARIELLIAGHHLVAAWVPAKHDWLRSRPLGEELVRSLGKQTISDEDSPIKNADDLLFLPFGTSSEVLDHLSGTGSRIVARRHLCSIPATTMSDIAASAVIVSSKISPGVSIGEDSLVYGSSISDGIQIGSLSIVVGVTIPEIVNKTTNDPYTFLLPDRHLRYGFKEHLFQSSSQIAVREHGKNNVGDHVNQTFHHKKVKVELPVRVDFGGSWSDMPPWISERVGCVLNMAITFDSSLPIGTVIETTQTPGVYISDDASDELYISDFSSITTPFDKDDRFRLVKSALLVTGIVHDKTLISTGLLVKTWARVPRGSGLGTSSILAAAVVKGLLRISDGDESNENVARLVLVLEQIMGTGGGWQDPIGGLYPGIKCTTSFPGIPLRVQVMSLLASPRLVTELQERLLVVFTGQVRFAYQVIEKVVTRYLQRDNLLISSMKRLVELAKTGREALMKCNIDELGDIMTETWRMHQEIDPHCSNEFIDSLFAFADRYCCGYKMAGAGGGGFALLVAKNVENAQQLKQALEENNEFDVKGKLIQMDQEIANFQQVKRFFEKLQESLAVLYMAHFRAYEASAEHETGMGQTEKNQDLILISKSSDLQVQFECEQRWTCTFTGSLNKRIEELLAYSSSLNLAYVITLVLRNGLVMVVDVVGWSKSRLTMYLSSGVLLKYRDHKLHQPHIFWSGLLLISMERRRAMAAASFSCSSVGGLPLNSWSESILTATYLINWLPTVVLRVKCPY
ncbi:bifunctional fucokinase/fucose pyrophosphorylase isoform X2, partial [Tanacetum coccineum]